MTSYLCNIGKVSRSGYYNYLKSEKNRVIKDNNDLALKEIILEAYNLRGYKKGAQQIKMVLFRDLDTNFNLKRIRRIMKKYKIVCPYRKPNPYKKIAKATKEHSTVPNTLKRNFKQEIPGKVLLTDITYLKYSNGKTAYLSVIKDGSTNEILAHHLSDSLKLKIATETIWKLKANETKLPDDAFIHSDQGVHYTCPKFHKLLVKNKLKQSMSRRGNCWDNAPIESFFGHLKDEINISGCESYKVLNREIDRYIHYYNNHRPQWNLKKLTPVEYRSQLIL